MSRVSHRASHIPNRPLTSASRDQLPMRAAQEQQPGYRSHEQLPGITKTISYPGSPVGLVSPTDTEFGHTPIEASFGDRIEPPPDRPLPERPSLSTRGGQSAQRSRSGTATQADPPRLPEIGMEKFSVKGVPRTYDSDGEGDDEFDRGDFGVLSPNEAEHYDDDQSHPSESEDEHQSVDGEDTPTTQGWGDRDGRSPTGKITQWSVEQVADYVCSFGMAMKQYRQTFIDEAVNGEALVELGHEELQEIGVKSIGHRLAILKGVYEHKIRAGIKMEDGDYILQSGEGETANRYATHDHFLRVIESIKLRDQRILAAEADLRALKIDLDRLSEENRKLREETLPIMRLMKDQRTPLPDPSGGNLPSPRDATAPPPDDGKGSSLSRKFSTKKLFLGGAAKQASPTHPPPYQSREIRDDGGAHLEASAAALAASNHLTASMTSQTSPSSAQHQQLSPTSPYSTQAGNSAQRSFQRDGTATRHHVYSDDTGTGYSSTSHWSQASTVVAEPPTATRTVAAQDRRRGQPSPRDDDGASARERDRGGDRDNPQVEIFKSFRVSIEDPCRVVLPVALKRYNIQDDWRQYALYIVHGDQERCLGLQEKPLLLFKQLDKEGRKPMFMLRRHAAPVEGWSNSASGSQGQDGGGAKQIPGGVL